MLPSYVHDKWPVLATDILHTLAQCYDRLDRKSDFVRVVVALLEHADVYNDKLNATIRDMPTEYAHAEWSCVVPSVHAVINKVRIE